MFNSIKNLLHWYLNPYYWVKPFFVSFIEEAIFNPDYQDYITGRMEIWTQWSQYDIDEVRFLTKKIDEFYILREKWDFKDLTWWQLKKLSKIIKTQFYENQNEK